MFGNTRNGRQVTQTHQETFYKIWIYQHLICDMTLALFCLRFIVIISITPSGCLPTRNYFQYLCALSCLATANTIYPSIHLDISFIYLDVHLWTNGMSNQLIKGHKTPDKPTVYTILLVSDPS